MTPTGPTFRLLVGLGNPGREYAGTRHNVGFAILDRIAAAAGVRFRANRKWQADTALDGDVWLCKPQTYMNLSGEAVSCLIAKPERSIEKLIVISDDLALPFGTIRIRPRGSHGGQNGLRSIVDRLKTQEFIRLRIGIGPEHEVRDAANFVLDRFTKAEAETLDKILDESADAASAIVSDGVEAAMARFN